MVCSTSKAIKNLMAAKITQIHLHNSSKAERLILFLNNMLHVYNENYISPESGGKYSENYY